VFVEIVIPTAFQALNSPEMVIIVNRDAYFNNYTFRYFDLSIKYNEPTNITTKITMRKYKKKLIQNMPIVKILTIFFFSNSVTKHPIQNNSLTPKLMKKFEVFNLSFLRHSDKSHQMHGK